jgi:acetyl esterase/lipase
MNGDVAAWSITSRHRLGPPSILRAGPDFRATIRDSRRSLACLVWDTVRGPTGTVGMGCDSMDVVKVPEPKTQPDAESHTVPTEPSRRRRSWGRRLLGVGIAILAAILVLIWGLRLYPQTLPEPLPEVALISSALSLFLVFPTTFAVGLSALAWRVRWRRIASASVVVSVFYLLSVILPWAAQANAAAQHNVPLELSGYLANPDPGKPTHTVAYATLGGQQLQLDVWQADHPGPARPGVLWAHGGGWVAGDRANWSLPKWGRWMADQGVTMFSVDYRLPPTSSGMGALTAAVKAQEAGDVKCALGWVQAHAADYDVDPSNLVLAGDSAGAHLAMLTAYTIGTANLPSSCSGPITPVKAVISLYGITYSTNQSETSVMPIGYVRPGLPPTLLIQGTNDHTVPPDNAPKLANQLAASGDQYELVQLPLTDHFFDIFWGSFSAQIARGVVHKFLNSFR